MSDFVYKLGELPNLHSLSGASAENIKKAEEELDLHFSDEYREYLATFGLVSFHGHELTGICPYPRLDVVINTINERINHPKVPSDYYVIEVANIDDIVFWQSRDGKVYQSVPDTVPIKISDSLLEYIEL